MTYTSFTNNMVKVLFNMRSSMTGNLKGNLSSMFKDNMRCQVMCHSRGILLTLAIMQENQQSNLFEIE